jgi:hypothetical protein
VDVWIGPPERLNREVQSTNTSSILSREVGPGAFRPPRQLKGEGRESIELGETIKYGDWKRCREMTIGVDWCRGLNQLEMKKGKNKIMGKNKNKSNS